MGNSLSTMRKKAENVERICDHIRRNPSGDLSLSALESALSLNRFYIQKTFKEVMGITPRKYVEECRIQLLKRNLREGDPIPSAIYRAGYNSQSWLYDNSSAKLGMLASSYRRGGEGANIRFMITECRLGTLLIAETDYGVCALSIGDSRDQLFHSLKKEFTKADIRPSGDVMERVRAVLRYFDGQFLNLPVDIQGTGFQRRVWAALKTIPYGETRSYQQIANLIGSPKAHRAVANACAANPVPLIVPCHRVVRKDGTLGGYALGIERKRLILQLEKEHIKEA
ncbi:MAG: methylated-DNA--[protein]-cysteine S-methyltransferase [Candidatus Thermoplasmatota archaeon]|nr:methylated-DNA--[protein]-cysteine S-methyltransferase [Candidatus Thermoplasmatota archaeon]